MDFAETDLVLTKLPVYESLLNSRSSGNSLLYINFIDYEKAFYSVDRHTLWKLLRDYGASVKIVSLIECIYRDMGCRVVHADQISEKFQVKTAVRQGCLLSPFLFLLVIDWIMRETMKGKNNGIQ